jgi:putative transposase
VVTPAARLAAVAHLVESDLASERSACRLGGVSRSGCQYQPKGLQDDRLRARLRELSSEYSRYGYLMLHGLLKAEGLVVNRKRTYRIYTEEGLQVRTKKRKKLVRPRVPMSVPTRANERWSLDLLVINWRLEGASGYSISSMTLPENASGNWLICRSRVFV